MIDGSSWSVKIDVGEASLDDERVGTFEGAGSE